MIKVSDDLMDIISELEFSDIITDDFNDNFNFDLENGNIAGTEDIIFYTIFGKDILYGAPQFTNVLTKFVDDEGFTNATTWKNEITNNILNLSSEYATQSGLMSDLFKENSDSDIQQKFNTYEPYPKGKIREFTFSNNANATASEKSLLKKLYSGENEGERNKWNGKVKLD